ncbi:VWA domain-containing protein [Massilia sp. SR12]
MPFRLPAKFVAAIGLKAIKYFVDSTFRDKVQPVPGSVLYCDLWVAAEHSGIYVGDGQISNIVVDGFAESSVCIDSAQSFTSKSTLGRRIYVSCDSDGAVGSAAVAHGANTHVGERAFYGLVFKNCHAFATKCVNYSRQEHGPGGLADLQFETWELTMAALKRTARLKLGATKWRLWDWNAEPESVPEPEWEAQADHFRKQVLNAESIERIRAELAMVQDYESEIADENIPAPVRQRLAGFRTALSDISVRYERAKAFLAACPGSQFTYEDLLACDDDFEGLAHAMQGNARIKDLVHKLGRNFVSEEKKKKTRIPEACRSEVHGTHRSNDVMRMLPSELLNLEDETLEVLFYARLLENNLLSYELKGTTPTEVTQAEASKRRTGPVVACLDTSQSMHGAPMQKAKALLLAVSRILKEEDRALHVVLFGAANEIRTFSMDAANNAAGLLKFLKQGFGGGTDFETPLRHALQLVASDGDYRKADILMISDGDCTLSQDFATALAQEKEKLNCAVYSVLCAGARVEDSFSDEVVVL